MKKDIRFVKGVGEKRALAFNRLGVNTLADLLAFYPRAYEDRTRIYRVRELIPGEFCSFAATVIEPVQVAYIRTGLTISKTVVADPTGRVFLTFFNQTYVKNNLVVGKRYLFYGKIVQNGGRYEVNSPQYERVDGDGLPAGKIVPVYPLAAGLTQKAVASAVERALTEIEFSEDFLPDEVRAREDLVDINFALANIHRPSSFEALERARERIVFAELFCLCVGLFFLKHRERERAGFVLPEMSLEPFLRELGFTLTGAQRRVIAEAGADMRSGVCMNRLVQGDVGSGKTAVAAALAWETAVAGAQTVLMAPTEVLASQHFRNLAPLFERLGFRAVLITGKQPAAARREAQKAAADGSASLIIGTHALITEDAQYANLGLVVCDEQHRFGVAQRGKLVSKGRAPHLLVMSATPIPRTLALVIYGDLDVSVLDELPPGRQKVDTFAIGEDKRERLNAFIERQIAEGHGVYIVCPAIDENDETELKSVTEHAEELKNKVFAKYRVGIMHGRMKPAQKEAVMAEFAAGKLDILVSTTVIEVGIDNPNATLMVIENAERFGLSQLHQLRGRVGRGSAKSYCVLVKGGGGELADKRLEVLCKTSDGFKIAEKDLELRGPGEVFGSRQHGLPSLTLAGLSGDTRVLKRAQAAAEELLAADPGLAYPEHAALKRQISALFERCGAEIFS